MPLTRTLVATSLVLAGGKVVTDRLVARNEAAYPPAGELLRVEGLSMHVVRAGAGRPVVYIHGAKGSVNDFTYSLRDSLARHYLAVAVDRPGCGASERPGSDGAEPTTQARLIHGAVRALTREPVVLIGHSLGAAVALAYALDHPQDVAAVVTLNGYVMPLGRPHSPLAHVIGTAMLGPLFLNTLLVPVGYAVGTLLLRAAFAPDAAPPGYAPAALANALSPTHMANDSTDLRVIDRALELLAARYERLSMPIVAVTGLEDRVIYPRQSRRLCEIAPHGELIAIPGAGHLAHFTHPEAVVAAVRRAWELAG
jgi:pimeloyl-ACP methyl ester carboxylesterase